MSVEDYLRYDSKTGDLIWIARPALCIKVGSKAQTKDKKGYVVVCVEGTQYKGHRVAWYLHYGKWPSDGLDHINRDKSDNRIENLRVASQAVNNLNKDKGASGEHYITKYGSRWQVRTPGGGSLGYADTIEEAKEMRVFYSEKL